MNLTFEMLRYHLAVDCNFTFQRKKTDDQLYHNVLLFEKDLQLENNVLIVDGAELQKQLNNKLRQLTKHNLFIVICPDDVLEDTFKRNAELFDAVLIINNNFTTHKLLKTVQDIFVRFDHWNQSLLKILFDSSGLQNLVNCSEGIIRSPFGILSSSNYYYAYSERYYNEYILPNNVQKDNTVPWKYVNDTGMRNTWNRILESNEVFYFSFEDSDCSIVGKNIFIQKENVGHIGIVIEDDNDCSYFEQILEYLADFVTQILVKTGKLFSINKKDWLRKNLESIIKGSKISDTMWSQICNEECWQKDDALLAVTFRMNPSYNSDMYDDNSYVGSLNNEIDRRWTNVISLGSEGRAILLVNTTRFLSDDKAGFFQSLAYFLRENLLIAGVSRCFSNINYFADAVKQADIAIETGYRYDQTRWYYKFDDIVKEYFREKLTSDISVEMVCCPQLKLLLEYDKEKGTEYAKTLHTYIQCRFNASESAKALHIQRSTLIYRMERIREISGLNLESEDEIRYLYISYDLLSNR